MEKEQINADFRVSTITHIKGTSNCSAESWTSIVKILQITPFDSTRMQALSLDTSNFEFIHDLKRTTAADFVQKRSIYY